MATTSKQKKSRDKIKATLNFEMDRTRSGFSGISDAPYIDLNLVIGLLDDIDDIHNFAIAGPKYGSVQNLSKPIPKDKDQRLKVGKISRSSPLSIELVFGSVAAFWALMQAFNVASNYRLNKGKLRNEIILQELQIMEKLQLLAGPRFDKSVGGLKTNPLQLIAISEIEGIDLDDL